MVFLSIEKPNKGIYETFPIGFLPNRGNIRLFFNLEIIIIETFQIEIDFSSVAFPIERIIFFFKLKNEVVKN